MKKAALYIRVSTEEQAMHGYSLDAQRENLTEYAKKHGYVIIDYYVDEGVSARKKYTTRKEFMRMLNDIQSGLIDIILFIKMDRWFRSVADYYKVQEILDKYKVDWKATMEDYDTATATGRLNLNIRLSIAQNESEMTSERIKFVFQNKVQRKEVITGRTPLGLKIQDKHLVHDEKTVDIVRDIFSFFETYRNKFGARTFIIQKYGIYIEKNTIGVILRNKLYKGEYHGVPDFCEPIIEPERFDRIQEYVNGKTIRKTGANRIYIFASLLTCADCGYSMCGRAYNQGLETEFYSYRCNKYTIHQCTHKKMIRESALEAYLLENIVDEAKNYIIKKRSEEKTVVPAWVAEKAKILNRITKLKELFVNELIDINEYRVDYERYQKELESFPTEIPKVQPNLEELEKLLKGNLLSNYTELSRSDKRAFWRKFIRKIVVDSENNLNIFFD